MVDLDIEDLIELMGILNVGPLRDPGLLEAAAARPQTTVFGVVAYPTAQARAAALLHSIARTHPLVDGNKRLGWLAALVTLDLNGYVCVLESDEAFDLVMDVASGAIDDVEEILSRLRVAHR